MLCARCGHRARDLQQPECVALAETKHFAAHGRHRGAARRAVCGVQCVLGACTYIRNPMAKTRARNLSDKGVPPGGAIRNSERPQQPQQPQRSVERRSRGKWVQTAPQESPRRSWKCSCKRSWRRILRPRFVSSSQRLQQHLSLSNNTHCKTSSAFIVRASPTVRPPHGRWP